MVEPLNAYCTSLVCNVTEQTALAGNGNRKSFILATRSSETTSVYVKFGTGITNANLTLEIQPGQAYESPAGVCYSGQITALTPSGVATLFITELRPS